MSGRGKAAGYSWEEEAFEIEVSVPVPKQTRAKDILFKATSTSIELKLQTPTVTVADSEKNSDNSNLKNQTASSNGGVIVLLDPTRKLRGRVNVDGTYWVISDPDDDDDGDPNQDRIVTVTIEKLLATPVDDFQVMDYDWKGVYANDEAEVSERVYDEPEKLNIREYAASLGVDIDNIDMSKVDKTMFSSKMNLTQSSLQQLTKQGYVQEITRQADGTEYTVNEDSGEPELFRPLGVESFGNGERKDAVSSSSIPSSSSSASKSIPFLDTPSPWNKDSPFVSTSDMATALDDSSQGTNQTLTQFTRNFTRAAFAQQQQQGAHEQENDSDETDDDEDEDNDEVSPFQESTAKDAKDPIDTLTVKRLKEILKSQGLKVSGTKKELQERLRKQVNSLLQGKQQ